MEVLDFILYLVPINTFHDTGIEPSLKMVSYVSRRKYYATSKYIRKGQSLWKTYVLKFPISITREQL